MENFYAIFADAGLVGVYKTSSELDALTALYEDTDFDGPPPAEVPSELSIDILGELDRTSQKEVLRQVIEGVFTIQDKNEVLNLLGPVFEDLGREGLEDAGHEFETPWTVKVKDGHIKLGEYDLIHLGFEFHEYQEVDLDAYCASHPVPFLAQQKEQ